MGESFGGLLKKIGKDTGDYFHSKKIHKKFPKISKFIGKRFNPKEKYGLYLSIGIIISLLFLFNFTNILLGIKNKDVLFQSDLRIINLVQAFQSPSLNKFFLFITDIGEWQTIVFGLFIVGLMLFLIKKRDYLYALILSVIGGEVIVWGIKYLVNRARPQVLHALLYKSSPSFPSAHSFVSFSFYGLLIYFWFKSTKSKISKFLSMIIGITLVFLIGLSRIYLGVHWPSDVLGGYTLGIAWLTIIITTLEIREKFNHKSKKRYKKKKIAAAIFLVAALFCLFVFLFYNSTHLETQSKSEDRINISLADIPNSLFNNLSRTSEDIVGNPMEPINIIIIATRENIGKTFDEAGWYLADNLTLKSSYRYAVSSFSHKPYFNAPATPSFWDSKPMNFLYEKPTNISYERHHIHFWSTPFILNDSREVWVATASFDTGIKTPLGFILPLHTIDPDVDKERDIVTDDLNKTGNIESIKKFQIVDPMLGQNFAKDYFFTKGEANIIFLR